MSAPDSGLGKGAQYTYCFGHAWESWTDAQALFIQLGDSISSVNQFSEKKIR